MKAQTFKTKAVPVLKIEELNFSQGLVRGFNLEVFQKSKVLLVGCGGIGDKVGISLVRKGIGELHICDDDTVKLKNLTRQLFHKKYEGKNKAVCLAKMLRKQGFFNTTIKAFPLRFQEMQRQGILEKYDAVICGVDNNPARVACSVYARLHNIPLIISSISRDATQISCAVQKPGKACFGCILPHAVNDESYPCNQPGIIDIMHIVAGFTVFALDSVLTNRHIEWNFKSVSMDGSMPDFNAFIEKKNNCQLCGKSQLPRKEQSHD